MMARGIAGRCALAASMLAVAAHAAMAAQSPEVERYPSKPVRFVVPSSVGGGNDVLARILGPRLSDAWGRQFVIDNRSGAGGIVGSEIVARAPADGYTILVVAGGYTLNPSLYRRLPYDTLGDFERVSLVACAPNVLVVHASVPAATVKELVALAKTRPGQLNYGSSGVGTTGYLSAEIFRHQTGIEMVHVPYKGAGDATAAIVGGQVHLLFTSPNSTIPHVRAGRLRALGVTSARRLPSIAEVPTIAEAGLAGYEVNNCYGILVPARTPQGIVDRLNGEVVRILRQPEVRSQIESLGFEVRGSTPREYTEFARADMAKWAKVLRDAGIRPE